MAVTIAVGTLAMMGLMLSPIQRILKPSSVAIREQWRQNRLKEIDGEIRMVQAGAEGYQRRDPVLKRNGAFYHPQGMMNRLHIQAPFVPTLVHYASVESMTLVPGEWSRHNVHLWRDNGPELMGNLRRERAVLSSGGPLMGDESRWMAAIGVSALLQIGMLGFVNLAVLAASNRCRRRRSRRDPHLA
ncbi:MAG: hypothetical protein ACO1SV_22885 [Fimbriimonas sp.]